jgi:hypothetical protein
MLWSPSSSDVTPDAGRCKVFVRAIDYPRGAEEPPPPTRVEAGPRFSMSELPPIFIRRFIR